MKEENGMTYKNTEEAVQAALNGNQEAYAYLYESYYKHVYISAKQIIARHEECEDIVQETFMRFFTKLQEGSEVSEVGGYLDTVAKNIAKDHIKAREAQKRPKEVLSTFQTHDEDGKELDLVDSERSEIQNAILKASEFYQTPEERIEEQEIQEIVKDILSELPDYQQEALSLFYLEGLKYREIAELYGVSIDTVKSRVNQGKKKVEKKVLELEKTKGIKLHSVAPIAIFFVFLRQSTSAQAASLQIPTEAFMGKFLSGSTKAAVANTVRVGGVIVTKKVVGIIVAAIIGVAIIGTGVGIYTLTGHEKKEQQEEVSDKSRELLQNDTTSVVSEETEQATEETEVVEELPLTSPETVNLEFGPYYKYWEEHRDELKAEGYEEGDVGSLGVSWSDVEAADGFEVEIVWLNCQDLEEEVSSYDIEKDGDGYYSGIRYKDAYDFITGKVSTKVKYEDTLQFVTSSDGSVYELKEIRIRSYRFNDEDVEYSDDKVFSVWECQSCGSSYVGEELPEDYECPYCHSGASEFKKL